LCKAFTAAAIIGAIFTTGCSNKKAADPMASVSGTATSKELKTLGPDAVAYVRLADITKDGVQGKTVVQHSFKPGADDAVPFELRFKAKQIDPKRDYALDIRVVDNGELVFITRGAQPVLTKGNPSDIDVKLEHAGSH
ncbi:MAG: YbaY family lipoprotein, partial [Chthoniobacterales bacterium]|nr:YbaY family lipoprotein [Chthoniobacterales bacterium]